ncbi:Cysteine--tRNA ligase [Candidatus Rhabdochlamydia sp. T3358]|nr:cysteine--tRNA ligase [Candidatus Rhabdochlamydia sp. T3358]VHO02103.1 Cysteine--tRNA ligase [Candidatus Rhabdochlamydia sp. T3358]
MMHLKIYNTESRKKEEVLPLDGKTIHMYTCGPTIYNYAHIGNFRTYIAEDLLRRSLRLLGYQIIQAMNITDIDDKTIKAAIAQKVSLHEYTRPYEEAFFEDLHSLNIEPVEYYPRATEYIEEMILIIQKLLELKIAYQGVDKSIYFSIAQFPSYGRLSHLCLDQLEAGASNRMSEDEYEKENIADFALWKAYDPEKEQGIYWDSPFGPGRPGWHIECSAMAMKLLGSSIDIHAGGVDNMFPHHENEIAQSEAFSCSKFVKYWVHIEHLLIDHKKMSKSLGNFYTLRDLIAKGYEGRYIRYLLIQTHYRTQLNFTFRALEAARASLQRIDDFIVRLKTLAMDLEIDSTTDILKTAEEMFYAHLADDLNISAALAALFELIRQVNTLCDEKKVSLSEAKKIFTFLQKIDTVLGCIFVEEESIPDDLQEALRLRQHARREKNWKLADSYRDKIQTRGYCIEDSPQGPRLKKMRTI